MRVAPRAPRRRSRPAAPEPTTPSSVRGRPPAFPRRSCATGMSAADSPSPPRSMTWTSTWSACRDWTPTATAW
ncbi:MAG: hypothetical protein EBQ99_07395 [Planctomycetes bacterium]|nr:hypothetical protein [Planctomycetota bacterium]